MVFTAINNSGIILILDFTVNTLISEESRNTQMPVYSDMNRTEITLHLQELEKSYAEFKSKKLKLNMARGNPCPEQLDLSTGILNNTILGDYKSEDGTDCRNYGALDGIIEAKRLFSSIAGTTVEEIIIGGSSSLSLMYDTVSRAVSFGVAQGSCAWGKLPEVKFLCPSPGYDRHFAICELFGIKMIPVNIGNEGPDMDQIENMIADDASIKGIWCVPKYSNPTGIIYSDNTVGRLASMKAAAPDFRILWDNAYALHFLGSDPDHLLNILEACKQAGNPDRVCIFGSTSKISYAGAGLSFMASSHTNIAYAKKLMSISTICNDKLNQLRHVKFLKSYENIIEHMRKHASILRPKFQIVSEIFSKYLGDMETISWSNPKGGYFISLDVVDGCATKVVEMAAEAGVNLTRAGATFPYGKDPRDRNIRIAPTYPPINELRQAMELVTICVRITALQKLLQA
jgi:aspartate/methionine/tyrosine aminotransferase